MAKCIAATMLMAVQSVAMNPTSPLMATDLDRRNFLRGAVGVAALGSVAMLSACAPGAAPGTTKPSSIDDEVGDLRVFDYAGNDSAPLWSTYEAEFAKKPEWTFITDDGDITAKITAGKPWDIAAASNNALQLAELEVLQPWDLSLIPNASLLVPSLVERGTIGGSLLQIPTQWGFESVMYRADQVPDIEQSVSVLFDDKYDGRIAWFDALTTLMMGGLALGLDDVMTMEQDALDEVADFVISKKHLVRTFWKSPADLQASFTSGDVWVAHSWPDSWIALKNNGMDVAYMTPKEGRMTFCTGFVLNSTSQNYHHAHEFVNAYIEREAQLWQVENLAYGAANAEVDTSGVGGLLTEVYGPGAIDNLTNIMPNQAFEVAKRYTETWQRVRAA